MTTFGTAHFVSKRAAIRYYRDYGLTPSDIDTKLSAGEIFIGKPEAKPLETLFVREGRYHIQVGY
jgi:hypothetical protein